MRNVLIICWAGLLGGCQGDWIRYGGRDPNKTVFYVRQPQENEMGFGTAKWTAREDGGAQIVGFGFHPMEHRSIARHGDYEPYPAIQVKWFIVTVDSAAAEIELKLAQGVTPENKIVAYRGRAEVRKMIRKNEVLSVETRVVELKSEDGAERFMVVGSIVAQRASEDEMRRAMEDYRKGVLPAPK